jgi:hypothetical protein
MFGLFPLIYKATYSFIQCGVVSQCCFMIIHEYDLRFVSSLLFWNFECEVRVIMSFHEFSDEELLSSVEEVELDKIGQNESRIYWY